MKRPWRVRYLPNSSPSTHRIASISGTAFDTKPIDVAKFADKNLAKEALVAEVCAVSHAEWFLTCLRQVIYTGARQGIQVVNTGVEDEEGEEVVVKGELWDLLRPLEGDCTIRMLTFDDEAGKMVFWHSSAHMLGEALEVSCGCHLCIGPPLKLTPRGSFYYDAYMGNQTVTEKEFKGLDQRLKKISKQKQVFERVIMTKEEALEMFADNVFKLRIISTKVPDGELTTAYKCGPLIDLCMGPHIPDTSRVKTISVLSASTSFFGGDTKNDPLQRIYGVSFPDTAKKTAWEQQNKLVAQFDHRKVGMDQELFFFHNLSPGCAMMLPHGARVYNSLINFIKEQYWQRGYEEVMTPNIYNTKLWETSGHWQHYKENMFSFRDADMNRFALKPMNCPGHCLMFEHRVRSYRDLPMRFADFGVLHRNEESGALTGLTRVRRFQQDDAHIFCRQDQIQQEVEGALDFMATVYGIFGMTYKLDLSTRPAKACGLETPEGRAMWDVAEDNLRAALDNFAGHGQWRVNAGDGAFYGPKIDIKVYDIFGREHQCATIQLDFQLPLRFKLQYKTAEQTAGGANAADPDLQAGFARPVMVHRAMLGSVERMMAVLIEHFQGRWPFWLSPRQAMVVPVHKDHNDWAEQVAKEMHQQGFFVDCDTGPDTMNAKIRNATKSEYNFCLVVGGDEVEKKGVTVRTRMHADNEWSKGFLTLDECCKFFKAITVAHEKTPAAYPEDPNAPKPAAKAPKEPKQGKQGKQGGKKGKKEEAAAPAAAPAEEDDGARGSSTHVDLKNLKDSGSGDLTPEEFAALRAKTKTAAEVAKNMTPEQQAAYGCKTGVAASAVRADSDDSDDDGADFGDMGGEGAGALLGDY